MVVCLLGWRGKTGVFVFIGTFTVSFNWLTDFSLAIALQ